MSALGRKISTASEELEAIKNELKSFTENAVVIKSLWKDFNGLLKTLIIGYVNFGRKHTDESESIVSYNLKLKNLFGLSEILFIIGSYSNSIGNYFCSQAYDLSHSLKSKNNAFSTEIESFLDTIKKNSSNIYISSLKIISEIKSESLKLVKSQNEHREVKNLQLQLKNSANDDSKTIELGLINLEFKLNNTIILLEESISALFELLYRNVKELKDFIVKSLSLMTELENRYIANIEIIVNDIKRLAFCLSEFRKDASERMKCALLVVSVGGSAKVMCTKKDLLETSDETLGVLAFIRNYLSQIADIEEYLNISYTKTRKASFLSQNPTDLIFKTDSRLEDLKSIFTSHLIYAENIRKSLIAPLDSLIDHYKTLYSSTKLSIKKIGFSFKKAKEFLIYSPTTPKSKPSINPLKLSKHKEINSILNIFILKEKSYLQSSRSLILTFHNQSQNFHNSLQHLQSLIKPSMPTIHSIHTISLFHHSNYLNKSFNILKERSRNNYTKNSYKNLTKDDEEFALRFSIKIKQQVIASYLCAYMDGIVLQGKLYITTNYIGFYSHFNSSTILGNITSVIIDFSNVISIEKKCNALIFDNSIEVRTKGKKYFFTSFVSRDEAFCIMEKLVVIQEKDKYKAEKIVPFEVEVRKSRLGLQRVMKDAKEPASRMFPDWYYSDEVFVPEIQIDASIKKVYQWLFSDAANGFHKNYLTEAGDKDIEITTWSKPPPDYFLDLPGSSWIPIATRTIICNHKLKERVPLMPTHALLKEAQSIYFINQEKFFIEEEYEVDIPFGNCFKSYLRWTITGKDKTFIKAKYGCVFSKSTIFKGKIIREGTKETLSTLKSIWWPLSQNHISYNLGITIEESKPPTLETPKSKSDLPFILYIIIILLILIITKLWKKVSHLELELSKS